MGWPCDIRRQHALLAVLALAGIGAASAQSLPEAFDPGVPGLEEAAGLAAFMAVPQTAMQQWSVGASSVSLAPGARATFAPLGWVRREALDSGVVWALLVQTDGYKRVTLATAQRSGLADVTLSSVWEQTLGDRLKGRATLGVIAPSHGEVGGKKWAAILGGGFVLGLSGKTLIGANLLVLQNAPPAKPGDSRTLWRADANLGVAWSPRFKTSLSGAHAYQETAPRFRELALLGTLVAQPGTELRFRVWEQDIQAAPRRRGLGIALALIR